MDLATYVLRQIESVQTLLAGLLANVTPEEWVTAPAPGHNPIGFNAWHLASIQDWTINTFMRNLPDIRSRPEWEAKGMMTSFLPFGMSLETAFEVARATKPADVVAYHQAVIEEARAYLPALAPDAFDQVPPTRDHLADNRYNEAPYLDQISGMCDLPSWRLFASACIGHTRGHLGEMDLALALIGARREA